MNAVEKGIFRKAPLARIIELSSQELFKEALLSLPLHPWTVSVDMLAGGIAFPTSKKTQRKKDIDRYLNSCKEKGIVPFTYMELEYKEGVFLENLETLCTYMDRYNRYLYQEEIELCVESPKKIGMIHHIKIGGYGYDHLTGKDEKFRGAFENQMEVLFSKGYHLDYGVLTLSNPSKEGCPYQTHLYIKRDPLHKGGSVGLHVVFSSNRSSEHIQKLDKWFEHLAEVYCGSPRK